MFNFGALASNVLNSLDNAAKDTLEEPRISATALRSQRQNAQAPQPTSDDDGDDDNEDSDPEPPTQLSHVKISFICLIYFISYFFHCLVEPG